MNWCQLTLVEESDGEDFMMKKINEEDSKKINDEDTKKISTEDKDFKHRHFQHASSHCYLYTVGIRAHYQTTFTKEKEQH